MYVSTGLFTGEADLGYSVITAVVTSIVWFGVAYLVSGVLQIEGYAVALGPLLGILVYLVLVNYFYRASVLRASAIAIVTWILVFLALYVAATLGYSSFEALGIPPEIVEQVSIDVEVG